MNCALNLSVSKALELVKYAELGLDMDVIHGFISNNGLSEAFLQQAVYWFDPLVEKLIEHQIGAKRTFVVGINGCQGSGKTTLAEYLCLRLKARELKVAAISIDDFYLTHTQRQQLALAVHPLLATRGVPGSHDLELALETLQQLSTTSGAVKIPKFNKAQDDRLPKEQWPVESETPLDIIILEGWCVGISAETEDALLKPVNELESLQDPNGKWRRYVNQQLENDYPALWQLIDCLIMLQVPSFSCVYQWRLEQEQKIKLASVNHRIMNAEQIKQFIQHYERLTQHSLKTLPLTCQYLFKLSENRSIVGYQEPQPFSKGSVFDTPKNESPLKDLLLRGPNND